MNFKKMFILIIDIYVSLSFAQSCFEDRVEKCILKNEFTTVQFHSITSSIFTGERPFSFDIWSSHINKDDKTKHFRIYLKSIDEVNLSFLLFFCSQKILSKRFSEIQLFKVLQEDFQN